MATCVEQLPCPDCGSSDSLQIYLNVDDALGIEWYTAFCHSKCWELKPDPYAGKVAPKVHVKTDAELIGETKIVRSCKPFKPTSEHRGIPSKFFKSWSVRMLLSEFDGKTPYAVGFPMSSYGKLTGWKCRPLASKNFFAMGKTGGIDPFGFERALSLGGEDLWVTEGEYDAVALDYCMTLAGTKPAYPVISLTHGGGSIETNFLRISDRLGSFKNIILVLDDDEVGHKAEATALGMWPDLIHVVDKPIGAKDANDAVENDDAEEMGRLALNYRGL